MMPTISLPHLRTTFSSLISAVVTSSTYFASQSKITFSDFILSPLKAGESILCRNRPLAQSPAFGLIFSEVSYLTIPIVFFLKRIISELGWKLTKMSQGWLSIHKQHPSLFDTFSK